MSNPSTADNPAQDVEEPFCHVAEDSEDILEEQLDALPWDRLVDEGETERAFAAFEYYLRLPPHRRTFANAYRASLVDAGMSEKDAENQVDTGTWSRWGRTFDWRGRARAYDECQASQVSEATAYAALGQQEERQERGGYLVDYGQMVLDCVLHTCRKRNKRYKDDPENEDEFLTDAHMLSEAANTPALRNALNLMVKGDDMLRYAEERALHLNQALPARQPVSFEDLSEEDRANIQQMFAALVAKAKDGDTSAIALYLEARGVIERP